MRAIVILDCGEVVSNRGKTLTTTTGVAMKPCEIENSRDTIPDADETWKIRRTRCAIYWPMRSRDALEVSTVTSRDEAF